MAQLLWGWLEFPVSFLTDAGRKVQSCNNSGWGRTETEQSQWGGVVTEGKEGALTEKQCLWLKIFRWKMSKGSFVPSMLNVFQKMWYPVRSYVQAAGHWPNFPLKVPHYTFLSQLALSWGYFMCSTKVWALSMKMDVLLLKRAVLNNISTFWRMEHQDPAFQ